MVDFVHVETDFILEISSEYRIKIKSVNYFICECLTSQVLGNKEMDMLYLTMLLIAKITQRQ
jgi:CRISPR/Cas system CMR-associated protein Cmr3 (group 5 of RAMP superfamily)